MTPILYKCRVKQSFLLDYDYRLAMHADKGNDSICFHSYMDEPLIVDWSPFLYLFSSSNSESKITIHFTMHNYIHYRIKKKRK